MLNFNRDDGSSSHRTTTEIEEWKISLVHTVEEKKKSIQRGKREKCDKKESKSSLRALDQIDSSK